MIKHIFDIVFAFGLIFAAIYDCKKREIPVGVFLGAAAMYAGWHYIDGDLFSWWKGAAISAAIAFGIYIVMACIGQCGGGDVIMMGCIGWIFGLWPTVWIVAISGIASLIFTIVDAKKKQIRLAEVDIPYALPVAIATILMMIWQYLQGGNFI